MQEKLKINARHLRKNMTAPEQKLWNRLRKKQFGGLQFKRQVVFGNYIVDFVCFDPKIIIEVDGSQHADQFFMIVKGQHGYSLWVTQYYGTGIMRFYFNLKQFLNLFIMLVLYPSIRPVGHLPPEEEGVLSTGEIIMHMHNPPHPGEILKECYIEPLHLTIVEIAKGLGVSRKSLLELVNGKFGVSPDIAIRLSKAFGTTPESWLNLQQQYDLWKERKKHKRPRIKVFVHHHAS